ncbi:MAG: S-adenosylmethionine:tRNA ribosyltransferase-isomerase, partial [Bacteroidia bacterium]|nr:S-adenosylmethionine:tRNA ribosyltransferase-isomerase [Bacteroidia bacterium]
VSLQIRWQERVNEREGLFHASWIPEDMPAHSIFERFGEVPLPPYIRRAVEGEDKERYQTFYAQEPGSVAAPTAGLHFTPAVWERLHRKGIQTYPVTLHVGVGTFLPLQNPDAPELHPMHAEPFSIQADTLRALRNTSGPVVCVGTTTLRVVESLYWLGCSFSEGGAATEIPPLIWRERRSLPPWREVLEAVPPVSGSTQLYILPGYPFPITQGLITNFHQPGSTLLGLVEGFIGREGIQEVYSYALSHGFRFLSYGDASLLWRT